VTNHKDTKNTEKRNEERKTIGNEGELYTALFTAVEHPLLAP
jgi:hypothetical protein